MAKISDLKINDLRKFLQENRIYGINVASDIYDAAFDLMKKKDTSYDDVDISIIEWMLAYNVLQQKIDIPSYTKNQIKNLNQKDYDNLAKSLGLTKNNMDNVVSILKFMHKLKESELDFEIAPDLYRTLLLQSDDLQTITKLIKAKPSLVSQIPELFNQILINNKNLYEDYFDLRYLRYHYYATSDFIRSLIQLKRFGIVEKLLPIISEDDQRNYFNLFELFTNENFLRKYFKYFPENFDEKYFLIDVYRVLDIHHAVNETYNPYNLIFKILETAVENKNLNLFDVIFTELNRDEFISRNGKFYISFKNFVFGVTEKEKIALDMLYKKRKSM